MSNILDKVLCLKLNAVWQAVATRTVRDAITDLTSIKPGEKETSALGLDLEFGLNEDGTINYDRPTAATPTEWMDWIKLPIRPYDLTISTTRGEIRVPTIVVARNYMDMPEKKFKASHRSVYERDKGICQASGRYVGREQGNLGHIQPKSRGGKVTFENAVWLDKNINTKMGARTPEEAGIRLIRKPQAPKPVPMSMTIREAKHPSWTKFIIAK